MRLVVRPHRPTRRILVVTLAILLIAAAGWVLLDYGQWLAIYDRMAITTQQKDLWERNRQLQRQNRELSQKLDIVQRSSRIDQQAYSRLRENVAQLQTKLQELTQELDFYRGILAATRDGRGLKVQGMRVEPMAEAGRYRFELVLTHVVKDDIVAEGTVAVAFEGAQNSKPKRLMLRDIRGGDASDLAFKFQHFRSIQGTFKLPEGFTPKEVHVVVSQKGRSTRIERTFDWARLLD